MGMILSLLFKLFPSDLLENKVLIASVYRRLRETLNDFSKVIWKLDLALRNLSSGYLMKPCLFLDVSFLKPHFSCSEFQRT
jgi:hypothetical protein